MKTGSESPQQIPKKENPGFQSAKKIVFTYPRDTTEAAIHQSVQYYVDATNAHLEKTGNKLRVSLGTITIGQAGNSKRVEVTGSQIGLIMQGGEILMKGGVPNPPPTPHPPIIPPDSLTYDSIQLKYVI